MSEFVGELTDLIGNLAKDWRGKAAYDTGGVWTRVCELGLAGIDIAEEAGGSGGGLAELVLVIQELARAGLHTPIVEASTAGYAAATAPAVGFDTIAVTPDLDVLSSPVTVRLAQVPYAESANRLVVVTASSVLIVSLADAAVTVEPGRDIAGIPCGTVRLDNAPISPTTGGPGIAQVTDRLALTRSAALLGYAQGAYDLTRNYVTGREQFGSPLIKIPAVSSTLAQMAVRIRFARSALDRATAACADPNTTALGRLGAVSAARICAASTATLVARCSHQLHGAVGITAEYGLHPYTSNLWALRDADETQFAYCSRLGTKVRTRGEIELWETISA